MKIVTPASRAKVNNLTFRSSMMHCSDHTSHCYSTDARSAPDGLGLGGGCERLLGAAW